MIDTKPYVNHYSILGTTKEEALATHQSRMKFLKDNIEYINKITPFNSDGNPLFDIFYKYNTITPIPFLLINKSYYDYQYITKRIEESPNLNITMTKWGSTIKKLCNEYKVEYSPTIQALKQIDEIDQIDVFKGKSSMFKPINKKKSFNRLELLCIYLAIQELLTPFISQDTDIKETSNDIKEAIRDILENAIEYYELITVLRDNNSMQKKIKTKNNKITKELTCLQMGKEDRLIDYNVMGEYEGEIIRNTKDENEKYTRKKETLLFSGEIKNAKGEVFELNSIDSLVIQAFVDIYINNGNNGIIVTTDQINKMILGSNEANESRRKIINESIEKCSTIYCTYKRDNPENPNDSFFIKGNLLDIFTVGKSSDTNYRYKQNRQPLFFCAMESRQAFKTLDRSKVEKCFPKGRYDDDYKKLFTRIIKRMFRQNRKANPVILVDILIKKIFTKGDEDTFQSVRSRKREKIEKFIIKVVENITKEYNEFQPLNNKKDISYKNNIFHSISFKIQDKN